MHVGLPMWRGRKDVVLGLPIEQKKGIRVDRAA